MQTKNILVLFGGESAEHDVSINSARNVVAAMDTAKYTVFLGFIDKVGKWWLLNKITDPLDINGAPQLTPMLGEGYFVTAPETVAIKPDVILPILHGPNGEDGTVQGLASLMHIPIVGCDVASAAICMDKLFTKQLLDHAGVPVVPYAVCLAGQPQPTYEELAAKLGDTLFVKPANLGSSVGISKARNAQELTSALAEAFRHDTKVLVETAINARELEVAVLDGNELNISVVGEITPDREFYDYDSKYDPSSVTKLTIPALIDGKIAKQIQAFASTVFKTLDCRGLARIDFFIDPNDNVYVNELNTMPGFTDISMYPKLMEASGVSYSELIQLLIEQALSKTKN